MPRNRASRLNCNFWNAGFTGAYYNKINYFEFIIFLATACTSLRSSSFLCQILYSVEQNTFFNKLPIFDELHSYLSSSLTLFILVNVANISSVHAGSLQKNNCCNVSRNSINFNFRGLPLFFTIISDFSEFEVLVMTKIRSAYPYLKLLLKYFLWLFSELLLMPT